MISINDKQYAYFDNAATTFLDPEVEKAMLPWLSCANANSHHILGEMAHKAVEKAREKIAFFLKVDANEIFFTSGASESNSWAISYFNGKDYAYALTSKIEHHSILNNPHAGIPLDVTPDGKIDFDSFQWWPRVDFGAFQLVNNITGVKQDLDRLNDLMPDKSYLLIDATQGLGKMIIDPHRYGVDFLSCSAHKLHGPKGIGLLYMSHRAQRQLSPMIYGGGQEFHKRGGTTPVAQIVGFSKAIELAYENMEENNAWLYKIHDYFVEKLVASNLDYEFIVDPNKQLSSHLNVAFPGIKGEQLLSQLSNHRICASTGSACDSDSNEPNYVLAAMGIDPELIESSIRFSFSKDTELADIDYTMEVLESILPLMK